MKEVYVVLGTLDGENNPDYQIYGVFGKYEDAKKHMISLVVPALDRFNVVDTNRYCAYNSEGLLEWIYDQYGYTVIMKLEKQVLR